VTPEQKKLLGTLKDLIENQIAAEYHDEETQRYNFNNLTVAEFLHMLEYMSWE